MTKTPKTPRKRPTAPHKAPQPQAPQPTAAAPPTTAELAAALNLSPRRISQLRKSGLPTDSIEAAVAWRAAQHTTDSVETLRLSRIRLLDLQAERQQIANSEASGLLVTAASVQADTVAVVSAARNQFMKLTSDLPPQLSGLDEIGICKVLRREFREVLVYLSDGLWTPRDEIQIVIDSILAKLPKTTSAQIASLREFQDSFDEAPL